MDEFYAALEAGRYDEIDDAFRAGQLHWRNAPLLLQRSVSNSWTEAVEFLLTKHGVKTASIQSHQLAQCHSLEIFKLLAQYQWPVREAGLPLLPHMYDHRDILDWLLDQGLDLNSPQSLLRHDLKKGESDDTVAVLNQAALAGRTDIFDYLVSRSADPSRCLALHYAALYQSKDLTEMNAVVDHLIDKYRFDVNGDGTCGGLIKLTDFTDTSDQTGPPLRTAVYHHNIPAIKALLRRGGDAAAVWKTALDREDLEALQLLLEAGADATEVYTVAATRSYVDATKLCLEYDANPGPAL